MLAAFLPPLPQCVTLDPRLVIFHNRDLPLHEQGTQYVHRACEIRASFLRLLSANSASSKRHGTCITLTCRNW